MVFEAFYKTAMSVRAGAHARRDGLGARLPLALRANDPPAIASHTHPPPPPPDAQRPACVGVVIAGALVGEKVRRRSRPPPTPRAPPLRAAPRARALRRGSWSMQPRVAVLPAGLSPARSRPRARVRPPERPDSRAAAPRPPARLARVANPAGSLDLARSRREFLTAMTPDEKKRSAHSGTPCARVSEENKQPNPRLSSVRSTDLKRIPPPASLPPGRERWPTLWGRATRESSSRTGVPRPGGWMRARRDAVVKLAKSARNARFARGRNRPVVAPRVINCRTIRHALPLLLLPSAPRPLRLPPAARPPPRADGPPEHRRAGFGWRRSPPRSAAGPVAHLQEPRDGDAQPERDARLRDGTPSTPPTCARRGAAPPRPRAPEDDRSVRGALAARPAAAARREVHPSGAAWYSANSRAQTTHAATPAVRAALTLARSAAPAR